MEIIDNINNLLGDNLKQTLKPGSKLKIAASCFSIYAYEALELELERIESLEFIFTSPTFVPGEATDKLNKEHRQYHIPKLERERSFYGSEFEIQLKNKLTQRAIAKECADWIRRKASFRSNRGTAPMQQFTGVQTADATAIYMPLHGFTAVDLGYQRGDTVSNIVNKFDEPVHTGVFLNLFNQIWSDREKLEDVTSRICDHQLVNYWPDITLDEYINLKERVENRMVIVDVIATADDNVLNTQSNDISYRKEQLRRLQEEVIEMEDLETGVFITDLGLNGFRMDLLNYIKANGDLANVPTGMNAVVPADPARGFVQQIEKIVWQHILATRTINLPETAAVDEIKVFSITLKTPELHHVLRCIDLAVPSPIIYELNVDGRIQVVASYKRPNEADSSKWAISDYFASPWLPADAPRTPLPVALNLAGLYEQLLHGLIPLSARAGETLAERVARAEQVRSKQREVEKIASRLGKEKQFNRKVEINAKLRSLKQGLEVLMR